MSLHGMMTQEELDTCHFGQQLYASAFAHYMAQYGDYSASNVVHPGHEITFCNKEEFYGHIRTSHGIISICYLSIEPQCAENYDLLRIEDINREQMVVESDYNRHLWQAKPEITTDCFYILRHSGSFITEVHVYKEDPSNSHGYILPRFTLLHQTNTQMSVNHHRI